MNDAVSPFILANKLFSEQRYDDVFRVYDRYCATRVDEQKSLPSNLLRVVFESALAKVILLLA